MLGVAHVLVGIPTGLDLFKGGQSVGGAVWQVRPELRRSRHDFLGRGARELGRLPRLLLDNDVAADRLLFFLHAVIGVGGFQVGRARGCRGEAIFGVAVDRRMQGCLGVMRVRAAMGRHDDTDYEDRECTERKER